MRIRIIGTDLPGRSCGPGPDFPDGHHGVHVAVQGRKGIGDLVGLTPGGAATVRWELQCQVVAPPPEVDLRGPEIHGRPGQRFVYLTWGVVGDGSFRMFRRAKVRLDAVPADVMGTAVTRGRLTGRLGLTDGRGQPTCASVVPPAIRWSAT